MLTLGFSRAAITRAEEEKLSSQASSNEEKITAAATPTAKPQTQKSHPAKRLKL